MNLNQVTINSTNPNGLIEFYSALGLQLIVDSAPRYVRFLCSDGNSTLSIHKQDSERTNNAVTLYFETSTLDEDVNRLKSINITFNTEITAQEWLWTEIELNDPDGNTIILYSAGNNRINPPWRVK